MVPEFDPAVTEYAAATTNASNAITAATESDAVIAITVNGDPHTNGEAATWDLGENTVVITLTLEETVVNTYTVTVTKS